MSDPTQDPPFYLTHHLKELRTGIFRSLAATGVGIALAYWKSGILFTILLRPFTATIASFPQLNGKVQTLQTLSPIEVFMINMKLAVVAGLVLASPFILREIWIFVRPALKPRERSAILMVFLLGLFFFAAGFAFGYYLIVPMAVLFLVKYNLAYQFLPQWTLQGYYDFVVNFLLIFGCVFELPLVLAALVAVGVATPAFLSQKRRHAIIVIFILAAFIAPSTDPITMVIVAVPLVLLYELGIWFSYLVVRRKNQPQIR